MKIIRSALFEQFPELIFGFSTKIGLSRPAPFHFNMSLSVGDDPKIVSENRAAFFKALGLELNQVQLQKQVHSDRIGLIERVRKVEETDAIISGKAGIGLAVSTADCANIYIYDSVLKVIAGVHSGWRSSRLKFLETTLLRMQSEFGCKPENMFAVLGPSIDARNYEVGSEFTEYFPEDYLSKEGIKYKLDLKKFNTDLLFEFGVPEKNVEISAECSYANQELHSYRREGRRSGRALGVIAMRNSV